MKMWVFGGNKLRMDSLIKLRNSFMILMAFFPILPYGVLSVITLLFVLLSLLSGFKVTNLNHKTHIEFFKFTGFYILLLVSALYSANVGEAIDLLIRMCPLLIFPFVFFYSFSKIELKVLKIIKACFFISTIAVLLIIFYFAYLELRVVGYDKLFYWATLTRATGSISFLDFHPNYISMYIALCIYMLIESKKVSVTVKVIAIPIFICIIILLSSRAVLIGIVISIIVALFCFVKMNYKSKTIISILIVSSCAYFMSTSKHVRTSFKISEIVKNDYQIRSETPNSSEIRIVIINCFLEQLSNDFFLGLGIGDLKDGLNSCYDESNNGFMKHYEFNTHNNYLFFLGSAGVLCFILFIYMLIYNIRSAFKKKQITFLMFLITMCVVLMFENILSRSYGVTFFSFFILVFYLEGVQNKK